MTARTAPDAGAPGGGPGTAGSPVPAPVSEDGAGAHLEVPWAQQPDYSCFGCSPHNAAGLRLRFEKHEADDGDGAGEGYGLRTRFRITRIHESYPGVVHGGVVSTICDEAMGNLVVLRRGTPAFTVSQRMRYFTPLAVGGDYSCVTRLRPDEGGEVVQAVAEVLDAGGEVMASASASYRCVPMDRAREHLRLTDDNAKDLTDRLHQHRDEG